MPKQPNVYDCGVFMIRAAFLLAADTPLGPHHFSEILIRHARRCIAADILLPPPCRLQPWMYTIEAANLLLLPLPEVPQGNAVALATRSLAAAVKAFDNGIDATKLSFEELSATWDAAERYPPVPQGASVADTEVHLWRAPKVYEVVWRVHEAQRQLRRLLGLLDYENMKIDTMDR